MPRKKKIREMSVGNAPVDQELMDRLNVIAHGIEGELNGDETPPHERKYGFAVVVFTYGAEGHCHFLSSGPDASQLAPMLKELGERFSRLDPLESMPAGGNA